MFYAQYDCKEGRSTDTAPHYIVANVEEQMEDCAVTFLDIEEAFDCTNYDVIEKALSIKAFSKTIIDWTQSCRSIPDGTPQRDTGDRPASRKLSTGRGSLSADVVHNSGRAPRKIKNEGALGVWLHRRRGHYHPGQIPQRSDRHNELCSTYTG